MLLLITKLYDAVSDPVMGLIADRTRTRWDAIVRGYFGWLCPSPWSASYRSTLPMLRYSFKHVYAYVTYLMMMTVYTAINVPYGAMLGVMTEDSNEKSVFSSYRMFFAYIGSFLAMGLFGLFEKEVIGTVNEAGKVIKGVGDASPMQWTLIVTVIAALCAILLCCALP